MPETRSSNSTTDSIAALTNSMIEVSLRTQSMETILQQQQAAIERNTVNIDRVLQLYETIHDKVQSMQASSVTRRPDKQSVTSPGSPILPTPQRTTTMINGRDMRQPQQGGPSSAAELSNPFFAVRLPRVEVPMFHGDNVDGWLFQIGKYFDHYCIPPDQRLLIATFYMAGDALKWLQRMHATRQIGDWSSFVTNLIDRFGPSFWNAEVRLDTVNVSVDDHLQLATDTIVETVHGDSKSRVSSLVWCGESSQGSWNGRLLSSGIDGSIYEWDLIHLKQKIVLESVGVSIWQMAVAPKCHASNICINGHVNGAGGGYSQVILMDAFPVSFPCFAKCISLVCEYACEKKLAGFGNCFIRPSPKPPDIASKPNKPPGEVRPMYTEVAFCFLLESLFVAVSVVVESSVVEMAPDESQSMFGYVETHRKSCLLEISGSLASRTRLFRREGVMMRHRRHRIASRRFPTDTFVT